MRFEFGELCLDDQRFDLVGAAGPVHLEPQVFALLHHLIVHRDRVVSKEELLDTVWGDRFVSDSALTSRVKAARRAVGDDGQAQRVIRTVHGRGYQFVAEVRTKTADARPVLGPPRSRPLGRDDDISDVIERLGAACLVTIVGPGGVGKTTVALAVAHQVQSGFADGAVLVDLTTVPPGGDVTGAVADAAGVEGEMSRSSEALTRHLALRQVLLVLDNCEHVLERVVALVDRMLDVGGAARILATSREPLQVTGEHVWPLGPLGDAGPHLFVERARAAEPRTTWEPTDPEVVELCRRLDNMPLALELAAGQLRRFDLSELSRRLGSRLTLLSRRAPGGAQRHGTMEATIDWSYRLLDPAEQELLRHLSVFPASFGLAAVEASAPVTAPATDPASRFGGLVDKSLVVREPGSARYRLLETIRDFARDRLEHEGEAPAAIERHRRHVCDRVRTSTRLDRWMSAQLASAYRAELQDARQAFQVSVDGGAWEDAVEIAVGAAFLWRNAIGTSEGNAWVEALQHHDLGPRDRVWVHVLAADVAQGRGAYHDMLGAAAAGAVLADVADDATGACLVAHYGAFEGLTDPATAKDRMVPAIRLARRSGDPRLCALMDAFLAVAALASGDYDHAHALTEGLDLQASEVGYDRFILHWAGWLLGLAQHDAARARRWMDQQHEFLDRTGIIETWITSFSSAMCEVLEGGDVRGTLARTLALADREGYEADADCLLALAYAEACAGRFEAAAELLGSAIEGGFNATAQYVLYRAVVDRSIRRHLPMPELGAALAKGRRTPAADALAGYGIGRGALGTTGA